MCGIVGYVGSQQVAPILLDGLSKLEYRGYDSAGVAVYTGEQLEVVKAKGRLEILRNMLDGGHNLKGTIGIGHTRWATHGQPSDCLLYTSSNALAYDDETVCSIDPVKSELSLPGWDESYTRDELRTLMERYAKVSEEDLWRNLGRFLDAVIPVCEEYGVNMAIHPDDPPWPIFGLPRIITGDESYARMAEICPSIYNGITLCTGSLGADPNNDLAALAQKYAERIHFVHARNVKITGERCFEEAPHLSRMGSLNLYEILKALHDAGFDGYIRPDHGRMIWGETGRPGYGLYLSLIHICILKGASRKPGRS